jgi:hypothetical protein
MWLAAGHALQRQQSQIRGATVGPDVEHTSHPALDLECGAIPGGAGALRAELTVLRRGGEGGWRAGRPTIRTCQRRGGSKPSGHDGA